MFDTICTLPLSSELFAQAVHPNRPLVTVGLSSGHVATLALPRTEHSDVGGSVSSRKRRGSNGTDVVDTAWRTKRHKGSCRCLAYSVDGVTIYSAGTDGVVKAAESETGRVTGKVAIPTTASATTPEAADAPTVVHTLSPQTLLLSTDSGALHLFDLRDPAPSLPVSANKTAFTLPRPSQTYYPHNDYISSLTAIPASKTSSSGYSKQFLTTGSTTLALTDLRRGVLAKSEDQEELLLSSLYITGLASKKSSGSTGEKAIVGGGDGVITLWEKGQWDDQDERIVVSREKETLDCIVRIPDGVGGLGQQIAVGMGDGRVRFVRLGPNQVVGEVQHDEVEGVAHLGFDVSGRMISGGGTTLKMWNETMEGQEDGSEEDSETIIKRVIDSDDDDAADEIGAESSEEEKSQKRRKKRKRGNGSTGAGFNFTGLD